MSSTLKYTPTLTCNLVRCGHRVRTHAANPKALDIHMYFPAFTSSKIAVPTSFREVDSLYGCSILCASSNTPSRPRIPAFHTAEQATLALTAALHGKVQYQIGEELSFEVCQLPPGYDILFAHQATPTQLAKLIGHYVCDFCMFDDNKVVVTSSWSLQVGATDTSDVRSRLENL